MALSTYTHNIYTLVPSSILEIILKQSALSAKERWIFTHICIYIHIYPHNLCIHTTYIHKYLADPLRSSCRSLRISQKALDIYTHIYIHVHVHITHIHTHIHLHTQYLYTHNIHTHTPSSLLEIILKESALSAKERWILIHIHIYINTHPQHMYTKIT